MDGPDCLFCKIVASNIPADIVYQDDHVTAFRDIHPQAPVHILVIPNTHVASILETEDKAIYEQVLSGVKAVARQECLRDFRVVINNGPDAGQTVFHLHFHILAGRPLVWPPG